MGDGFELVIEWRKKEWKLIVTFHTTADAIAFEKSCKESNKDGRMIPVPRELSLAAGLPGALCPEVKEELSDLAEKGLSYEEMTNCLIRPERMKPAF